MNNLSLSPLATASRELVIQLAKGAHPDDVEAGCRDLLTNNTNGLGSIDTRMVDVASEIVRGVLAGVVMLRSPGIIAAARGVSDSGTPGPSGDAERLSISERTCREVRDSPDASDTDFNSALEGAAPAARMTTGELRDYVNRTPADRKQNKGDTEPETRNRATRNAAPRERDVPAIVQKSLGTQCVAAAATQQRSEMTIPNKTPEQEKKNKDQQSKTHRADQGQKPDRGQQSGQQLPGKKPSTGKK